jgi:hypothetical protein
MMHRQCILEKPTATGHEGQTTWLPERFARVGKSLRLLERAGWEDGWVVRHVSATRITEEQVNRRDYLYCGTNSIVPRRR